MDSIFNIMVETVVREVLFKFSGTQEADNGLGWVAVEHNIVFYAGDRPIAGRKPIWFQMTLTVVVRMFERVGL